MELEEETKDSLKKWGKVCTYGAVTSLVMVSASHATLETEAVKVTNMLLGTMFHGVVAATYGYVALPAMKEYNMGKVAICTLIAGVIEFAAIGIKGGTVGTWFG